MALTRPKYSNIVDGDFKNSCRVATTTNINLNSAPLTYDGVTLAKGDRVLVTAQNVGSQNGIYTVLDAGTGSNGTWIRSFDANDGTRLSGGSQTSTGEGSYAGAIWRLVTPDPISIGGTPLVWATGSAFAGGATRQVQYNDDGILAGTSHLLIDEISTNVIVVSYTDTSNVATGAMTILGGMGIAKSLTVGNVINVANALNVTSGPLYSQSINTSNLRVTGGSITGFTGAATTLQVDNFSSANIYQTGTNQSIQTANAQIGEDWGDTSRANLAVGNIRVLNATIGNVTTLAASNFSSGNIYQSAADTFVATNFSTTNVRATSGSITGFTGAATTLQVDNFSSPNVRATSGSITGFTGAATTLQVDNFSSPNVRATGGSITGFTGAATTLQVDNFSSANIYQSAADTLVATNFSTTNVRATSGSITGFTGSATTLQADNFSSANIYQSAADTFVATNFSSGNIYQSAAGTLVATNFSSGNIYQSRAGTLVSDNFSSANAQIASGYADNFQIGANVRASGYFNVIHAHSDSAVYANLTIAGNLTVFGNVTTVGSSDLTLADSIINLHSFANLAPLTNNDGRDIGIKMHYYDVADSHAFVGRANDTGFLEWYAKGTESTGNVFVGTHYGTIKAGEFLSVNATPSTSTTTGAIRVTGGIGISDGLYVNGTSWFQNASTANAVITGGSITGVTGAATTLQADNFSSPNVRVTGGSLVGVTGAYSTLQATNFSSANIYQSASDTFVASNFSSGNIYQSAAGTLVATNFSSANIYQSAADTFVATNFSTTNVRATSGSITGFTGAATTLQVDNFSSANIYQSAADTLVASNFSSGNVQITGGTITVSGVVQPNANATINLGDASAFWNNFYAKTIDANLITVGNDIQVNGNVKFEGNIYQNGDIKFLRDYDTSSTPPPNPIYGDRWYDTTTDTIYEYTTDGSYDFWLDTTGIAVTVTYTATGTAPLAPKAGDYWYDTSSDILYTRVDNGTTSFWVDFTTQAPVNSIANLDTTIQVPNGGTGKTIFTVNTLIKGNGTGPLEEAIPGTDYIAPSANSVITNYEFAGEIARFGTYANISTLYTSSIVNSGTYTGTGMTLEALTVNGNIIVGNLNTATDIRTEGHLIAGNVYANNMISGVNLTYSGNIQYDNLVVGNVFASNVHTTTVVMGSVPGATFIDCSVGFVEYANNATVDFPNFSGMIIVTIVSTGNNVMYLCGGGSTTAIGASIFGGGYGTIDDNPGINGYTWTNNTGGNLEANFAVIKTRNSR
jgi:hypothetical protein